MHRTRQALLGTEKGIEAANGVLSNGFHRTGTVEYGVDVGELMVHIKPPFKRD